MSIFIRLTSVYLKATHLLPWVNKKKKPDLILAITALYISAFDHAQLALLPIELLICIDSQGPMSQDPRTREAILADLMSRPRGDFGMHLNLMLESKKKAPLAQILLDLTGLMYNLNVNSGRDEIAFLRQQGMKTRTAMWDRYMARMSRESDEYPATRHLSRYRTSNGGHSTPFPAVV